MLAASLVLAGCELFQNHGPIHYTYGPEPTENQHLFPSVATHDAGPDAGD